jgi:predicted dithiol-disulfide oxidoreductase (DUF899 family)
MTEHRIGTHEEWQAAREELLKEEKELTRRNDELARKRRELPWVPVEKEYRFETEDGTKSLAELFDGRLKPFLEGEIPPTVERMAKASGTDVAGYVADGPGLSAYALSDGEVYPTYVTTARGLEPAMGYYGLLDRTPMGRHEEGEPEFWLRDCESWLGQAIMRPRELSRNVPATHLCTTPAPAAHRKLTLSSQSLPSARCSWHPLTRSI